MSATIVIPDWFLYVIATFMIIHSGLNLVSTYYKWKLAEVKRIVMEADAGISRIK